MFSVMGLSTFARPSHRSNALTTAIRYVLYVRWDFQLLLDRAAGLMHSLPPCIYVLYVRWDFQLSLDRASGLMHSLPLNVYVLFSRVIISRTRPSITTKLSENLPTVGPFKNICHSS